MGRPKGSRNRNHKRKYTRRNGNVSNASANDVTTADDVASAERLLQKVKGLVLEAADKNPEAARLGVVMISHEVFFWTKLIHSGHPAP